MAVDNMPPEITPSHKELYEEIYVACAKHPEKMWTQEELLELRIIPNNDVNILMASMNRLAESQLLETLYQGTLIYWKIVNVKDAERMQKLTADEAAVYRQIALSQREGVWIKKVKPGVDMHPTLLPALLKRLESKGFIKSFQSAKHPRQKTYILSELQPSEDTTGGIFYDQGELDQDLLESLMKLIEVYVHRKSWHYPASAPSPENPGKRKRPREEREEPIDEGILNDIKRWKTVLPMPAGYIGFPTVSEISSFVNGSRIFKEKIMEAETQKVMDLLCWDGRVEKVMKGQGYRTILHPFTKYHGGEEPSNGLGESPCGSCPVFDLCDNSGPVNAQTCTYFGEWLSR